MILLYILREKQTYMDGLLLFVQIEKDKLFFKNFTRKEPNVYPPQRHKEAPCLVVACIVEVYSAYDRTRLELAVDDCCHGDVVQGVEPGYITQPQGSHQHLHPSQWNLQKIGRIDDFNTSKLCFHTSTGFKRSDHITVVFFKNMNQ